MGVPAAKEGDMVTATDIQIEVVPAPPVPPAPTPLPCPFAGVLNAELSSNVKIMGLPAATVTSIAINTPPLPTPPGTVFVVPPSNQATIILSSTTAFINRKQAARNGDIALTCNDPVDLPVGNVVAVETVMMGG